MRSRCGGGRVANPGMCTSPSPSTGSGPSSRVKITAKIRAKAADDADHWEKGLYLVICVLE